MSEILARKIKATVKDHFQNINLRIAFKSPATLDSHFPFKDKVPKKALKCCLLFEM